MRCPPALLLVLALLAGCAGAPDAAAPACPAGLQAAQRAELFFGRGLRGGGEVSDAQVDAFLAEVLTPAFPDGLTVMPARGQWRHADGRISRERSLVVIVILPGAGIAEAQARAAPVAQAWVRRFGQDSVLRSIGPACVGF